MYLITFACLTKYCLFEKLIKHFHALHIEPCDFFRVGRFAHAEFFLHHLLRYVGNIGTIGTTLNGIGLPMVVRTPNARFVHLTNHSGRNVFSL